MQKITPFLWFDGNAEEAVNYYVSVFKDARIGTLTRYGSAGPGPEGAVMIATFSIQGMEFTALNGGPNFKFTEAISFVIHTETQEETDHLWEKLSEGGEKSQCGWLKDKFGLSWQVTPNALIKCISGPDKAGAQRAMKAMMTMSNINIAEIQKAYDGK